MMEAVDVLVGLLLGVIFTVLLLFVLEILKRRKSIILDDPTDDEDYKKITRQLRCPGCGSTDFYYTEVTSLSWIKGEDRYCICRQCGQQFGDGK